MKKRIIGLLIAVVTGVAIYWLTSGIDNQRQRDAQAREAQRTQEAERLRQEELARQREIQKQLDEDARRAREADKKAKQPVMSAVEMNFNRNGSDYKDFVAAGIEECLDTCLREPQCKAITFTKSSRQCWLKSSVPLRSGDSNYDSAVKVGK